jgi:hypothetical protein
VKPDPASWPSQPLLHQLRMMIPSIVQEYMDQPLARIHRLAEGLVFHEAQPALAEARDFAVIRSVLSTARKQRWNILQTLTGTPARLITDIREA